MKFTPLPLHIISRWLFGLTLIAVTVLAFGPPEDQVITTGWDKTNHLLAFFTLLWLLDLSWPAPGLMIRKIVLLMTYGLLIEIVQAYISYRSSSVWDWLTDGLGLAVYLLLRPGMLSLQPIIRRLPFVVSELPAGEESSCRDC